MRTPVRLTAVSAALGAGVLGVTGVATADTSPNGILAFSAWNEVGPDIYTVDPPQPDVPAVQLTIDGRYNANPDWSPDGTKIAYDGWATFGGPRIQVMDADPATEDWTVLSDPCPDTFDCYGDFQPAWSPDGSRIAFVSTGRGVGEDACDLWLMDPYDTDGDGFGDNMAQLTFDENSNCSASDDFTPAWSPDSSLIAFSSTRVAGYWDIWLVNADDPTDLRNVTRTPIGYEDQAGWSPDGTQVTFRKAVDGVYQVFSLPVPPPADSGAAAQAAPKPKQLTFGDQDKDRADWGAEAGSSPGTATLKITKHRHGKVTSDPTGISCGQDCANTYVKRTMVELKAIPKPGYVFKRWTGTCDGNADTCSVRVRGATSVGAKFVATG